MRFTLTIVFLIGAFCTPLDAQVRHPWAPGEAYTSPAERTKLQARRHLRICEGYPIDPAKYAALELRPDDVEQGQPALLGDESWIVDKIGPGWARLWPKKYNKLTTVWSHRKVRIVVVGTPRDLKIGDTLRGLVIKGHPEYGWFWLVDDKHMTTALDMALEGKSMAVRRGRPFQKEFRDDPADLDALEKAMFKIREDEQAYFKMGRDYMLRKARN